ncbi:MAG TPA: hypothetical protein VGB78_06645 [Thermoplasmata archaeon]
MAGWGAGPHKRYQTQEQLQGVNAEREGSADQSGDNLQSLAEATGSSAQPITRINKKLLSIVVALIVISASTIYPISVMYRPESSAMCEAEFSG